MNIKTIQNQLMCFAIVALVLCSGLYAQEREQDFNFEWKFTLLDDNKIPNTLPLNDSKWRDVRLPHDWSVEASFSDKWDGATGYLPGGVGVYQKHFKTSKSPDHGKTYILFDGVYNNATFWLNGKELGKNPYGYSPVYFDLTDKLKTDGTDNIITVHVDHSRYVDSRWYTGSGIYRNVKLITTDYVHIPIWGTFVTTPEVSSNQALVNIETSIKNDYGKTKNVTLKTEIFNGQGKRIAVTASDLKIASKKTTKVSQSISVLNPLLWEPDNPNMYKTVSSLLIKNKVVETYETPFGIRDIVFKAKEGFFLNGKSTFMKGVCLHHDAGLVGSAVPKGVWRRRLQLLKDGGVNAIRTSHNPFSQEFLDLCDEMGFLVQNEIFDEFDYPKDKRQNYHDRHDDYISRGYTEHFQKWGQSDLTRTILRDRNHPSVVQWSIGNEIEWTYLNYRYSTGFWKNPDNPQDAGDFWGNIPMYSPEELKKRYEASKKGDYILAETAERLNGWVKNLDTTRPTTANLIIPQISHVSGYADAVDLVGYSYRNIEIPWAQTHFPSKQVTINECPGTWDDWKQVLEYPGVFSMFMWTGIDYLGESYERWPGRRPWGDMLDLAGFKLQGFNYFKSIWKDESHLSIGTLPIAESGFTIDSLSGFAIPEKKSSYKWRDSNMHWNYKENDTILVEVCSNYATVELLLNGKSLGYRSMSESPDRLMRWAIPFQPGKLEARAVLGNEKQQAALQTTSKPERLVLKTDKTKLKADAYDVAHLVVQLEDENGLPVKTENSNVEFTIEGSAKLLGVDSANFNKHQDFQSNTIETFKGRALAIIQSTKTSGTVTITAKADGFASQSIELTIK